MKKILELSNRFIYNKIENTLETFAIEGLLKLDDIKLVQDYYDEEEMENNDDYYVELIVKWPFNGVLKAKSYNYKLINKINLTSISGSITSKIEELKQYVDKLENLGNYIIVWKDGEYYILELIKDKKKIIIQTIELIVENDKNITERVILSNKYIKELLETMIEWGLVIRKEELEELIIKKIEELTKELEEKIFKSN